MSTSRDMLEAAARAAGKERPILFSAPMVRAILAGTKTQTRRVVKPRDLAWMDEHQGLREPCNAERCPYGRPGQRLWVRESHWWFKDEPDHSCGYYPPKLTREDVEYRADGDDGRKAWRPSIHMPRWASRITLEITGVRVERLRDISEADAIAEGITRDRDGHGWQVEDGRHYSDDPRESYASLWETINGPGSWGANPWVWCIAFKRVPGDS